MKDLICNSHYSPDYTRYCILTNITDDDLEKLTETYPDLNWKPFHWDMYPLKCVDDNDVWATSWKNGGMIPTLKLRDRELHIRI